MKTYQCTCGNTLYFENSQCLSCGKTLGFIPDQLRLSPLQPASNNQWQALAIADQNQRYRQCRNYTEHNVCNWMIPEHEAHEYCLACRLNEIIPDLTKPQNMTLWYRTEQAKRRLIYNLLALQLPIISKTANSRHGLGFRFMEDVTSYDVYSDEVSIYEHVMIGHSLGTITINIAEADPSRREEMREKMNESYRTLLGHFRHEAGHYYWERLIDEQQRHESFRAVFGDERHDYQASLQTYYSHGPKPNWQAEHISAYASAHPWEDWAETWAHYLHITDTLETAHDFGFHLPGSNQQFTQQSFDKLLSRQTDIRPMINDWQNLATALNAMNRSMGLDDPYPFALSETCITKLQYVHECVVNSHATG